MLGLEGNENLCNITRPGTFEHTTVYSHEGVETTQDITKLRVGRVTMRTLIMRSNLYAAVWLNRPCGIPKLSSARMLSMSMPLRYLLLEYIQVLYGRFNNTNNHRSTPHTRHLHSLKGGHTKPPASTCLILALRILNQI